MRSPYRIPRTKSPSSGDPLVERLVLIGIMSVGVWILLKLLDPWSGTPSVFGPSFEETPIHGGHTSKSIHAGRR